MPLIPLQVPPGVYRNGTDLQAANRWRDASLVRWSEGVMRPVGGWEAFTAASIGSPVRGCIGWRDNLGERNILAGTYNSLKYISSSGIITDITPAGLVVGDIDATGNTGYGGGTYGTSTYGTVRIPSGVPDPATVWSMDTFGQYPVALSPADGRTLIWLLNPAVDAAPIAGAPVNAKAIVVTEERFLMVLGAGGDARKVQWCDQGDYTSWTPAATNQAGDFTVQTNGSLMLGARVRGQTLLLTGVDAHTASYIGPPFVFGFERVGTNCGIISADAAASVKGGLMWMGTNGFYMFNGGAVERVPCEVSDYVFGRMNVTQASKVSAVCLAPQNEVWFFYPSGSETDSYVVFNYAENHWSTGTLSRTSGLECGVFDRPMWFDPNGKMWRHEIGVAYPGAGLPYAETGPMQLGNGDQVMSAVELIPDERTQGDVIATFKTRFYPNDIERSYGPYQMANPTSVRFTGREIRMRVEGNPAQPADWRVGIMRVDAVSGGQR